MASPAPTSPAPEAATPAVDPAPLPHIDPHVNLVEADLDALPAEGAFSDFGDSVSDTTSLASSVLNYTYENGRRYHAYRAGQYILPNDDAEQDRLDMIHHIFSLTLKGALCATKLENPQNILDLGTGTGIWAIDAGDLYPSAKVIGTDLSPIQPSWTPPNVVFEVDDATSDWTFPENHFDFIHARTLGAGIRDWPALIKRCYRHLKPGGKIEIAEGRANFYCQDNSMLPKTTQWLTEFHRIGNAIGVKFDFIEDIPKLLEDAGFEGSQLINSTVPLGTWAKDKALKEVGAVFRLTFLESGLDAYSTALFNRNGWKPEETEVLLAYVRAETLTNKMHLYTYVSHAIATKPLDAPAE